MYIQDGKWICWLVRYLSGVDMAISVVRMAQGSKEAVECEVTDTTGAVTTLVGTSPTFVVKTDAGATQQSGSCSVTGMTLQAILDSSTGGGWPLGHYNLYFSWTIAGEVPVEGPFDIYIV
jgi:hypothetical protein